MSQEQIIIQRPSFLSGRSSQEDILKLLDDLEGLADNTHQFFGRAWGMDLDRFHTLTNKIRASLPDEVRRASRVANDSDKIVSAAKEEAELTVEQAKDEAARIVNEARSMAEKLIDQSEINKLAKAQAQEIIANAEANAKDTTRGADEYAREVLASIENHLAKVMGALQKGREKLDVRVGQQQPAEPPVLAGRRR